MGIYNLEYAFRPSSIAVIGASEQPGKIGNSLMKSLIAGGFTGELFPVNPEHAAVMGRQAYDRVDQINAPIDLALIAVPIDQVPAIIMQCGQVKVKNALIISSGGKEIGPEGQAIEMLISSAALAGGLRIIGPNCLGIIVPGGKLNASFTANMPNAGSMAFVSQSGAICAAILDLSLKEGIGFSHFVSIGSMLDVDFGDIIDFLGREPQVKSILLYVEHLTNLRKFMSAARAISRVKPIIVLKAGSSSAGAQAAASHTGALAGEDNIYDAAFKRAGIVRVSCIEELFDCARLLDTYKKPAGERVAVITNGGGPGVMAVDAMAQFGLAPADLSATTIEHLDQVLPRCWSGRNPVDMLGDASADSYKKALEIVQQDRNVHALLVILCPQALADPTVAAEAVIEVAKTSVLPIIAVWMGGREIEAAVQLFNTAGIASYTSPERAVRAFSYLVQQVRNARNLYELPSRFSRQVSFQPEIAATLLQRNAPAPGKSCFLYIHEAAQILTAYGIDFSPTELVYDADEAAEVAERRGFPVVLKLVSPNISHKTEAEGVRLNLWSKAQVHKAYEDIVESTCRYNPKARITGMVVQPMIMEADYELFLGAKRDPLFGPIIVFGMGGIFAEVLADRSLGLPPMNRYLAQQMIDDTKVAKLLAGYRNVTPIDREVLEQMIISVSQLVADYPEIVELDINPVIVKNGKPLAVDARMILRSTTVKSPLHLIISPYPRQYECERTIKSGKRLLIRPVKPDDADLFRDLFHSLSATSVYFRFFSHIKELSAEMLALLTQVDYDRHLALVALDVDSSPPKMLAAARIIGHPDLSNCEFSVLVSDAYQGQGIGAQLLLCLLHAAREQGVQHIWGKVLRENKQMINLGKRLGFSTRFDQEDGTVELSIDLRQADIGVPCKEKLS
jgi:acetyltransferase